MGIIIRRGTAEDTEDLIAFLDKVRDGMEHKEWFYLDPAEYVRKYMQSGVMQLWLAMDGDKIAAIFDTLEPGLSAYNYGYDLGLSKEELMQVIHLDNAAVAPDYRGLGLQRRLIQVAEKAMAGKGRRILLCTVHPQNKYSLQNALMQGYTIQKEVPKYGSVRYILRKDIL